MSNDSKYILEFDGVSYLDESSMGTSLSLFSMALKPGDLAVVLLERNNIGLPLCDLAEGMLDPDEGVVSFSGESWSEMSPRQVSKMRGNIGRVFHERGWVSNLSVYDNLVLNRIFHTNYSEIEIKQEAESIARKFGLDSLSTDRPDVHRAETLRKYEWVRALVGSPDLILMQHPATAVKELDMKALLLEVTHRRENGAAVLWTTPDSLLFGSDALEPTFRYEMINAEIKLIAEG